MIVGGEKVTETAEKVLAMIDDDDELVEVDEVFVIVAVHYGASGQVEEAEEGSLFYRCTSARIHAQAGLLEYAKIAVLHNQQLRGE